MFQSTGGVFEKALGFIFMDLPDFDFNFLCKFDRDVILIHRSAVSCRAKTDTDPDLNPKIRIFRRHRARYGT
jgi:hypothetical protein